MSNSKHVLKIIKYSVGRKRKTFGHGYDAAYHTIRLGNEIFQGQRDISKRLANIKYDFKNKVVFDIGCNIGGMLHGLAHEIKHGVGIDYNAKAINAANAIKAYNNTQNVNFYTFDLQTENLQMLNYYALGNEVDICFVLAIALWVKNWKDVVMACHAMSPSLLYESNGNEVFQDQQHQFLKSIYANVEMLTDRSEDDNRKNAKAKMRKLFVCRR